MGEDKKLQPYSTHDVKACLDECAIEFVKREKRAKEDTTISNIVLVLGYAGCILAAYTHFTPIPFPQNLYIIITFVLVYGSISGTLQIIDTFVEKDRIFKSKNQKNGGQFELRSSLPLYNNVYSLSCTTCKPNSSEVSVKKLEGCISKWFYADGTFSEIRFKQDMREYLL